MAPVTTDMRKLLAKSGAAMPDGSYYIRNASDLHNAILSVGRGDASHDVIRKHCITRAKALGLENMIPANWNADGSLKHVMSAEEFFEHFGVKGMHWGVRNDRVSNGETRLSESNRKKLKTAGLVAGSVAVVALAAAGTIYVQKHGGLSSFSSGQSDKGKSIVEDFLQHGPKEPSDVLFASRGKHSGTTMLRTGGLTEPLREYDLAGFTSHLEAGRHVRYGTVREKIAVAFRDPEGRSDFSGRPIVHHVVLPRHHAEGITTFEGARDKAWSLVKDEYNRFWPKTLAK